MANKDLQKDKQNKPCCYICLHLCHLAAKYEAFLMRLSNNFQAWRIDTEERPSFGDIRVALELLQSDINSGALDSPPDGRV